MTCWTTLCTIVMENPSSCWLRCSWSSERLGFLNTHIELFSLLVIHVWFGLKPPKRLCAKSMSCMMSTLSCNPFKTLFRADYTDLKCTSHHSLLRSILWFMWVFNLPKEPIRPAINGHCSVPVPIVLRFSRSGYLSLWRNEGWDKSVVLF